MCFKKKLTYLGQPRDSEDNNNNNSQNQKSSNQGESSAINEEDDIDTALNKLEKSLANTTVGNDHTNLSATKAPVTTPEFKLALSEQLLLMQLQKLMTLFWTAHTISATNGCSL